MLRKDSIKIILYFTGLFILSVFVNYYLPSIVKYFWFLSLLGFFFFQKNKYNYFWIIFFWLLFSAPGHLFSNAGVFNLPIISVLGLGREVLFQEIFIIIAIAKAIIIPVKQDTFYQKKTLLLISYSGFLLFLGFIYGMDILTFFKSIRYFIPIVMLYFLPRLIHYSTIKLTVILLIVSSSILIGTQFFDVFFGYPIAIALGEVQLHQFKETSVYMRLHDVSSGTFRAMYGPFIILSTLIVSFAMIVKREMFKNLYGFYVVIFACAVSIFLSATRGWIIAVLILFIGFGVFQTKQFNKVFASAIIIFLILILIPKVNLQLNQAFNRLLTIEALVQGDLTAEGTLSRITERGPRVMDKFKTQPFFGFGFSEEYYDYQDPHVGNQTLLLNGGIIGYAIYSYFIIYMLYFYLRMYIVRKNRAMLMFFLGLISLIVIHSSSRIVFGYSLKVDDSLALSFFFFFSDFFSKPPIVEYNRNEIY